MPPFFARLLHLRLSNTRSANVLRKTLLGHRFVAKELLEEGIVDEIVPAAQLQERAIQFGNEIGVKSKGGSWGEMKVSPALSTDFGNSLTRHVSLHHSDSPTTMLSPEPLPRRAHSCPTRRPRSSSKGCKKRARSGSTGRGRRLGQSCRR